MVVYRVITRGFSKCEMERRNQPSSSVKNHVLMVPAIGVFIFLIIGKRIIPMIKIIWQR